jgi:glycine/D-amino acid oxidase-like deaminating enzyme
LLIEGSRTGLVYVVYRSQDVIIGGTAEEGDWRHEPDPTQTTPMLAAATTLAPEMAGAAVLDVLVGLRPCRAEVRLEAEFVASAGHVIHCYGHGGGVSLSWGCVQEVVKLVATSAEQLASASLIAPQGAIHIIPRTPVRCFGVSGEASVVNLSPT